MSRADDTMSPTAADPTSPAAPLVMPARMILPSEDGPQPVWHRTRHFDNSWRMNQDKLVDIVSSIAMVIIVILAILMTIAAIHATFFSR